jgi:hypothetical protein
MMSRPCAAVLAALATTAIGCTACTAASTAGASPARHHTGTSRPAAAAACPAVRLPVSQAGLGAAAVLAARFTAAYLTRPPGQSSGQWLARLAPLVTGQLYRTLARTAATPALWPPGQPAAAATIAVVRVRDLAAGSAVLTVTARVRQADTTTGMTTAVVTLAVTVVSAPAGWAVYDVEPAAAGNTG